MSEVTLRNMNVGSFLSACPVQIRIRFWVRIGPQYPLLVVQGV